MLEAYKKFWRGYVDFTGRSTRSDYWWVVLWNFIIYFVFGIFAIVGGLGQIHEIAQTGTSTGGVPALTIVAIVLYILYTLAIILPSVALAVRRLRDAGFHWALIFLSFIPYVGGLVVFILNQFPTKEKA